MALIDQLRAQVDKLAGELDRRSRRYRLLESYYEGMTPFPAAVKAAKVTQAYRHLMPVADAPWGSLVVGSVLDRLEIGEIRDKNAPGAAEKVWDLWQANHMDSESKLAHCSGLISGRSDALVWPAQGDGELPAGTPEVSLDNSDQMIVRYQEGSRHKRVAALRRWEDADSGQIMATLYRPEGIYKFRQPENSSSGGAQKWEQRTVEGEDWPVVNEYGVVPVVEIGFNPRLKAGVFGFARGEYEHCLGLIDRINLLTFLGLVVAFWMGFPVRGVIGDRILRDDDGNVIPPFDVKADSIVQLENPNARFDTFEAADRSNLSVFPELAQLAAITKTPRHYFPLSQPNVNISADAIRADEGALNAKITDHKASAGEGWLGVARLIGQMSGNELSPNGQVIWLDHESRSMAERADAATKLATILPWQVLVERVLNANQDDIARWEAMRASDTLGKLITAAETPPASSNGSGHPGNVAPEMTPAPAPG